MIDINNLPRAIRNNNPGNIKYTQNMVWLGVMGSDSDGFCRFDNPAYGVRAMLDILITYYVEHNLKTVKEIIDRWDDSPAPNHQNYIDSVTTLSKFYTYNGNILFAYLSDLAYEMHRFECGEYWIELDLFEQVFTTLLRERKLNNVGEPLDSDPYPDSKPDK